MVIKRLNPNLVVGAFFFRGEFVPDFNSKGEYLQFSNMSKCLRVLPNGPKFTEYLLLTGAILKSYKGAFTEIDYNLFPRFLQNTNLTTLATRYGHVPSFGAGVIYNMAYSEQQIQAAGAIYKTMVEWGIQRLVTDDTDRIAELIGRTTSGSRRPVPFIFMVFGLLLLLLI